MKSYPEPCIIPLYPKIRLSIQEILIYQVLTNAWHVEQNRRSFTGAFPEPIAWDIRLSTNPEVKRDRSSSVRDLDELLTLLRGNWPKFIWRVTARSGDCAIAEFLFDATDVPKVDYKICDPIFFDPAFANLMPSVVRSED